MLSEVQTPVPAVLAFAYLQCDLHTDLQGLQRSSNEQSRKYADVLFDIIHLKGQLFNELLPLLDD